jgi:hypothetical protein
LGVRVGGSRFDGGSMLALEASHCRPLETGAGVADNGSKLNRAATTRSVWLGRLGVTSTGAAVTASRVSILPSRDSLGHGLTDRKYETYGRKVA